MALRSQKTKIVATVGPPCDAREMLEQMTRFGMSVARLNFSHGTFDEHAARIERLRASAKTIGREIAVMADLPGPKMRIGQLAEEPIQIAPGCSLNDAGTRSTRGSLGWRQILRISQTIRARPMKVTPYMSRN
jgi:pyruvate kinase